MSSYSTSSFCFDLIDTERIIMFSFDWPLAEPVQILTGNTVHCEKVACYISAKKRNSPGRGYCMRLAEAVE